MTPRVLYVSPDGPKPSGILTFGKYLHDQLPDALFLSLQGASNTFEAERETALPIEKSHDAHAIARALAEIVTRHPQDRFAILPNVGIVSNAAAALCVHGLSSADRQRARIIGAVHRDSPNAYSTLLAYQERYAAFFAVSKRSCEVLQSILPDRRDDIRYLPYASAYAGRKSRPNPSEPLRLVYVGRLEEADKRVSRLIRIAAELRRRAVPFHLRIIGDGNERPILARLCEEADLQSLVTFAGPATQSHLFQQLADFDAILLTSAFEGLPNAIVEGMSARLCPVVMELPSGLPEIVIADRSGLVAPQGDIDAMADAVESLHQDRAKLEALKSGALATIEAGYTPARLLPRFLDLVEFSFQQPAAMGDAPAPPLPMECDVRDLANRTNPTLTTVIFGAGQFGLSIADALLERKQSILAILDSDSTKQGRAYRGISIGPPRLLLALRPCQIVVGSIDFASAICNQIKVLYGNPDPCTLPILVLPDKEEEMPFGL